MKRTLVRFCTHPFRPVSLFTGLENAFCPLGEMPYRCEQAGCGAAFVRVSGLKDHTIIAHTKQYNFRCEKCGKGFLRNAQLLGKVYQVIVRKCSLEFAVDCGCSRIFQWLYFKWRKALARWGWCGIQSEAAN